MVVRDLEPFLFATIQSPILFPDCTLPPYVRGTTRTTREPGRDKEVLQKRNLLKEKTMALRRQNYLQMAGV